MRNVSRGPRWLLLRRLSADDGGAIAVLVALLIGGVIMGLGALVIDIGQLYQERAQLQNGADAAALSVAADCAAGGCTTAGALSDAQTEANRNAKDGVAGATVCGTGLATCPASTGAMTDCPSAPSSGSYVDVHTSTQTSGGSTVIAPVFGKELTGNGSYSGTTVQACSQAAWGGIPTNALSTAFTISACQWDSATSLGTVFAQPPPYPPNSTPAASYDEVLKVRTSAGTDCSTEPSGSDAVGHFGWITETGGCTLQISGTTYSVKSGTTSLNCNTPLFDDAQNKSLIYVPVFTKVTGSGASAVYNLKGIAGFVVTGYNIPGTTFTKYTDWLKSTNQCTGTTYCINGYFVSELIPVSGTLSTNLGLYTVRLTG